MKKISIKVFTLLMLWFAGMSNTNTLERPEYLADASHKEKIQQLFDTVGPSKKLTTNLKTYTNFSQFIPKGYSILDTATGNLNLDAYPDMLLALKKDGEEKTSDVTEHPEQRPLLILLGQPDHTFALAARSDNSIYCVDCGGVMGDPYQSLVIKKGFFSVEHYGGSSWRWTRIVTFKYNAAEKKWYLFKDGGDSFHASEPEKVKRTIKTAKDFGKIPFEKFDVYKD
jgi:hypothetical protein